MSSFFEDLPNLYTIEPKNILLHLSGKFNLGQIENYLANKVLYPSFTPLSPVDLAIEVAILKEVIRLNPTKFFNKQTHKILIYPELKEMFPNLLQMAVVLIDILRPAPMATFTLKGEVLKDIGTYLKPTFINKTGQVDIQLRAHNVVSGKSNQIKINNLIPIPAVDDKVDLTFLSEDATLFGLKKMELEVFGGELGVVVDTRI